MTDVAQEGTPGDAASPGAVARQPDPAFEALLEFLKENRGFDFTGYKRSSLARRFDRRMHLVGVEGYEAYLDHLQVHPEEFVALFNTILINVTSFLRDGEAWAQLRSVVLPQVLASVGDGPVRVWSAGCASGQEAYTLAVLLCDALGTERFRSQVKVYGTDVDEEALEKARLGTYSAADLSPFEPRQVEAYFEPTDGQFAFRKDLRRNLIFGRNDLVQDAPISRIDLLTCRNTLMYFNAEQQSRIISRLHFALRPTGVLFLGKAEMLLSHSALFEPVDLRRRFFRRRDARVALPLAESVPDPPEPGSTDGLLAEAWRAVPVPLVVVDGSGSLALANGRAQTELGLTGHDVGRPFSDVELSFRPIDLRGPLAAASRGREVLWLRDVEGRSSTGEGIRYDVQVIPLWTASGAHLGTTVAYHDVTNARRLEDELAYANRQLETAFEELQSTNEELETTNEELQSTVEELETTNEELQSTNEELETMNEELQSMNDELHSSNDELRDRTGELDGLNRFMESILGSLRAAVTVVDRDLRVTAWNARAEDLWGLRREEALGEHLLNLDIGLPVEQVRPLVRTLLLGGDGAAVDGDRSGAATAGADDELQLDAVNRRGRPVRVRVVGSPLRGPASEVEGVILLIDLVEEHVAG